MHIDSCLYKYINLTIDKPFQLHVWTYVVTYASSGRVPYLVIPYYTLKVFQYIQFVIPYIVITHVIYNGRLSPSKD